VINAREIVTVDFEFEAHRGERPVPVCAVAHELRSGRCHRIWQNEFGSSPPWATGADVLTVIYFASADLGCYRALNWEPPERVLDLYVEFRVRTNGLPLPADRSLLGALTYFGLAHVAAAEKHDLQQAIGNGTWRGRYTPEEILDYCEADVTGTDQLFSAMAPGIDLPRALLRGRYMAAVAAMEWAGVPIDVDTLEQLRENWDRIKERLVADVDRDFGVFEGTTLKRKRFAALLVRLGIPWPFTPTGQLALDDDTLRQMSKAYPVIAPLRELLHALSEMRLNDLMVGSDARNRALLSPFASRTGRNQPSNVKYIFGPSVWLRGLIKPQQGTPAEIGRIFAAMAQERPDAVLVSGEGDLYAHRQLIAELAEKHRLPAMCPYRDYVEAGGLMAYAVDLAELLRRMADDVHQILKGTKPGDIPIYQATKFQLLINLKTAKALGLTIPLALIGHADEVIE
jgi:hypothetical protein